MFRRESLPLSILLVFSGAALAATPAAKPVSAAKPAPAPEPPPDATALVVQAKAAVARGENDLAVVLAQSAIVADPARPSSYDALGDIYVAQNQPDYARNFYEKALAIDPTDADATKAIAALDRAGDSRKAEATDGGAKSVTP